MITGFHSIIYSDDVGATRAFFRDVLGWPWLDAHDGWLIFKTVMREAFRGFEDRIVSLRTGVHPK